MTLAGLWKVPRLWPGATVFILGGGPTLPIDKLDRLRNSRCIAINQAWKFAPWVDVLYWGDRTWLSDHGGSALTDFPGLRVTDHPTHRGKDGVHALFRINGSVNLGLTREPHKLCWNLSSGAAAINLAVHLGAAKIVLLGYDMHLAADGSHNFHHDYPPMAKPVGKAKQDPNYPYTKYLKVFPAIAAQLQKWNIECVNATPGSYLTVFPIVDPDTVIPQEA